MATYQENKHKVEQDVPKSGQEVPKLGQEVLQVGQIVHKWTGSLEFLLFSHMKYFCLIY